MNETDLAITWSAAQGRSRSMTKLSRLAPATPRQGGFDTVLGATGMQWNGFILVAPLDRDSRHGVDPVLLTCAISRIHEAAVISQITPIEESRQ
jgi:hypothetical protein